MYSIGTDNELKKDGAICYCVHSEGSCSALCAAFEELAKGRVVLHCVKHSIIAPREMASAAAKEETKAVEADPLADLTAGLNREDTPAEKKTKAARKGKK